MTEMKIPMYYMWEQLGSEQMAEESSRCEHHSWLYILASLANIGEPRSKVNSIQ